MSDVVGRDGEPGLLGHSSGSRGSSVTVGIGPMPDLLAPSLASALRSEPRYEYVIRTLSDSGGGGKSSVWRPAPDVLIVAYVGEDDAAEIANLMRDHPGGIVIALVDDPMSQAGKIQVLGELGVRAFLPITAPVGDIAAAIPCISLAVQMLKRLPAMGLSATDARDPMPSLTKREQEVHRLLCRGLTNRQIATALWISPETAKDHVSSILAKVGVYSRRQLRRPDRLEPASERVDLSS